MYESAGVKMSDRKQWFEETLLLCKELGYRTTPVFDNGKTLPFGDGQDYKTLSDYKGVAHIGLVLDEAILVDYDGNKVDDIMSVDELAEKLGEFEMPDTAQIRGNSIHWLYKNNGEVLKASADGHWLGIDLKTGNQLMHLKQGKSLNLLAKDELESAPIGLIEALKTKEFDSEDSDLGDFEGLIGDNSTPRSKVLGWLDKLDNNMANGEWVKVGQALHNWHPIDGLELWENWSIGGDTYREGECETRWRSFKSGKGVTVGTLCFMANEVDYDESKKKIIDLISEINIASEKEIELSVVKKISKLEISDIERETLVKTIQTRLKTLTTATIPVSTIRAMIKPKALEGELITERETPNWCKPWVYVNAQTGYVNLNDLVVRKAEAFNLECGKHVPVNENGNKPSANKFISDYGFVESVASMAYLPKCETLFCKIDGIKVLNTFNKNTLPKPSAAFTEEGLSAIKKVERHISFICNFNPEYAAILTQWIAHNVQYKGEKILWSPVIQSIEGIGKSWFGELLEVCLGEVNVGTVAPTQATSDFNGWATNVCVNILNELRVKGHNRHDAVNALKPLITDKTIQINDKGVKQYKTLNTTNYICFTNYKDALPIDSDSRRWWFMFVDIENLAEVEKIMDEPIQTYFPSIFDAIRCHGGEILKWLLEYKITDEFKALKQAPETEYKSMMVATENSSFEFFDEVKELIEIGGAHYNVNVISSNDLFNDLKSRLFEEGIMNIQGRTRNVILKKLGYMQLPHPIKIDGKARRIWAKRFLTPERVRELFSD